MPLPNEALSCMVIKGDASGLGVIGAVIIIPVVSAKMFSKSPSIPLLLFIVKVLTLKVELSFLSSPALDVVLRLMLSAQSFAILMSMMKVLMLADRLEG